MNSTQLAAAFRSEVRDEAEPYMWSTADVYRYMDTAQTEFVRKTGGIPDSTTASVCAVTLIAGLELVALSPKILKPRGARWADQARCSRTLEILNFEQYETMLQEHGVSVTGHPRYLVSGMEPNALRVLPVPVENVDILLVVDRLPLYTLNDVDQALEIDEQHHEYLIHGMKARAYLKDDAETYDRAKSIEQQGLFDAYCAAAMAERSRYEHRYRTVAYGGI